MKNSNFINWRLFFICLCFVGAIFLVIYKILSVQIEDSLFLQNEGKKRYIKYRDNNPVRGAIYDRNKFPLAVSIVNYDLYALNGLSIDDIEVEERHSRHYPMGEQVAPLVGFYGKDKAQEGIEKSYDSILSGVSGKEKFYTNAKQEIISKPIEVNKTIKGKDIYLTIDSTIQFYSYKYLVETIIKNKAKAGTVLVFDNYLGIVLSVAVDKGIINPDMTIEIPRRIQLNNKIISDTKNYGQLTPKEIIAYSSQVGASQIALKIGYD